MNKFIKIPTYFWTLIIGSLLSEPVVAASLSCEAKLAEAAIPRDAYYLPESEASQLQNALDTHSSVRLKPAGDYTKSFSIKLRSNQSLFGLAGTKLPQIFIPEGTSNAILSGVSPGLISFEGFTKPSHSNCLNRILNTRIEAKNALLENNLFTDLSNIQIDIDTSQKGYLRNNRFIRTLVHGMSPAIQIIGDKNKISYGNLFIWTNILIPNGDSIIIQNQKDISFVGIEGETWNIKKQAKYPGMLNVSNTDFLSVTMASGGDYGDKTGQYFNLDSNEILLQGTSIGTTTRPGIILGKRVKNLFTFNVDNIGIKKYNNATQAIDYSHKSIKSNVQYTVTPQLKQTITSLLNKQTNIYNNWEKPTLYNVNSPANLDWESKRSSQPDSSDKIQSLIDKNGIVELDSGTYYIAKPLILREGQGIIGSGINKTVLIAKSSDIDIIVGGDHIRGETKVTNFVLADITLQGGRNGINHTSNGSGDRAQYNLSTLSHVAFRNMKNSGIFINNIYAWDNNYIDYVQFIDSKTGVMQRPDINYSGGDKPGMTYLDKNVFYSCRFENNEIAVDWPAKRANNLNSFISSIFKNNSKIIIQKSNNISFFANSIFQDNSGNPSIDSNMMIGFVKSYFSTIKKDTVLFDNYAFCNSCLISEVTNGSKITSGSGLANFFINTNFDKSQELKMNSGMIVNSYQLP